MMQHDTCYVYIMSNMNNTVLYRGVSNNLQRRVLEHKQKRSPKSFTARYNVDRLVYYEQFGRAEDAIAREKQLKAGSRSRKVKLIERENETWLDLAAGWYE